MDNFILKRSERKTISITIDKELNVVVKAPHRASNKFIKAFVTKNKNWIEKAKAATQNYVENTKELTEADIAELKEKAKAYLPTRVEHFKKIMDVNPASVKITAAKTRWGSCSAKNGMCFSYRTMLLPEDVIDYIVVHELSHIVEKNHSDKFYKVVEKYLPNYLDLVKKQKELEKSLPL